jgi:hypothetical protein
MDCPQCGTALTTYALRGHEALVCERCGYVGIEADHHGTAREAESWRDALRRYYDESGVDSDPHVPVRPDRETGGTEPAAPEPRPAPEGVPAVRPSGDGATAAGDDAGGDGADGGDAGRAGGEGGKRGTDEDGTAVDDGVQSSVGGS